MLVTIPGGTPAVHLPFKGFSNRQAQRSSRALQSLVCGSQAPHRSQPPSWVNRHCMHVLYAQTKKVFFQLRPGTLKRVKRCCSPLWELKKPKGEEKDAQGVIAASESSANKSDQTRAGIFAHNFTRFYLPSPVSVTGRGKPLEGSGRTGTEEQTNLLRKEDGLQRLTEMQTPWRPPSS